MEIVLILVYVYLPYLFKKSLSQKSFVLLEEPIFLKESIALSNNSMFLLNQRVNSNLFDDNGGDSYRNSNYAVSFWVFMNPNDVYTGDKGFNILSYSGNTKVIGGKPNMLYVNDGTNSNIYRAYVTDNISQGNEQNCYIDIDSLPIQTWNFFVFNYYDNHCDVFVNGAVKGSISFNTNNIPTNGTVNDSIVVGQNVPPLNGAIGNVKYHKEILTQFQIVNMYNLLHVWKKDKPM